jgi:hypothetical protein
MGKVQAMNIPLPILIIALIVAAMAVIASGVIAYLSIQRSRRLREWNLYRERDLYEQFSLRRRFEDRETERQGDGVSEKLEQIVKDKKNRFLNMPGIAFHFADKELIENFYTEYFKEPT